MALKPRVALAVSIGLLGLVLLVFGYNSRQRARQISTGSPAFAVASGFPRTLTDARGKRLTLYTCPQRIVSLAPSNTEVLYALGAGDKVVAVTTADDYPPEVRSKPRLGDVLNANTEAVLAYNPDLIVALRNLNERAIKTLDRVGVPLLVIDPKNLAETYDSIRLLGRATGQEDRAESIIRDMQNRISRIQQAVSRSRQRPRVLIMYQTDPIYTSGPNSFIGEAITVAGGANIVDRPLIGDIISSEQVILRQPDVIICGKDVIQRARLAPGWAGSVPAVLHNRFFLDDTADATLVRPTPRLARGIEKLARYLHPDMVLKEP